MGLDQPEPILASWKISKVLDVYPQLLDVLIDLSPAFGKLRNPMLRKVQTRLVTVQQAAGIARLEPAFLTRELNRAIGLRDVVEAPVEAADDAPMDRPDWVDISPIAERLDVREMFSRGEEPFGVITAAAMRVSVGEVLQLMVGFEPLPLYDALAKQGFSHWTNQVQPDAFEVFFHRDRSAGETTPTAHVDARPEVVPVTAEVTIDVSELVPPEPMVKILTALEALPAGGRLLVHHVRRPMHLYPQLDDLGYVHETTELSPDRVQITIDKTVPLA